MLLHTLPSMYVIWYLEISQVVHMHSVCIVSSLKKNTYYTFIMTNTNKKKRVAWLDKFSLCWERPHLFHMNLLFSILSVYIENRETIFSVLYFIHVLSVYASVTCATLLLLYTFHCSLIYASSEYISENLVYCFHGHGFLVRY